MDGDAAIETMNMYSNFISYASPIIKITRGVYLIIYIYFVEIGTREGFTSLSLAT